MEYEATMMLSSVMMLALGQGHAVEVKLVMQVQVPAQVTGNPYEPAENNAEVIFRVGTREERRLAFYDGKGWTARTLVSAGTKVSGQLMVNGKAVGGSIPARHLGNDLPVGGMVKVDPKAPTRFVLSSGEPFLPFGTNTSWANEAVPDLSAYFAKLAAHGGNWGRVWANHWDGKNPYMQPDGTGPKLGWMIPEALAKWDDVVKGAESNGIRFQFVLFHHGLFSTDVNPNWDMHPWNAANGGFLKTPTEFFTNATAKRLTRNWLRYAVARWGHSSSIFCWELFNEVEWVEPARKGNWKLISDWHGEMADYIRSIDPYKRMVSTSSHMDHPELWEKMDFISPHGYPPSVLGMVSGMVKDPKKPQFFGEFGGNEYVKEAEAKIVRDGIWASLLRGHSGVASYWYWDRMEEAKIWPEMKAASEAIAKGRFALRGKGVAQPVTVSTKGRTDLEIRPGVGWGKTTKFRFALPEEATGEHLGKLSAYFNNPNGGNAALFAEPLRLSFTLAAPGSLLIDVAEIAAAGAAVKVSAMRGGREVTLAEKSWPGKQENPGDVSLQLPAGKHEIIVTSTGADWFRVARISIPGLSPTVFGMAFRDGDFTALRLRGESKVAKGDSATISLPGLPDGDFKVEVLNFDTKAWSKKEMSVKSGRFSSPFVMPGEDVVLLMTRSAR